MVNLLKKHDFPLRIERFFTSEDMDAFERIHFRETDSSALESPDNWSAEAVAALAEGAACASIPESTRSIEENTVPSWLWQRTGTDRVRTKETSVRQIFHRAAGAAAYTGWKNGVFAEESEARAFFDEMRYMLAQRFIAVEPKFLAGAGLDWAYGIERKTAPTHAASASVSFESGAFDKKAHATADIRNASIDALLGGDKNIRRKWKKFLATGAKTGQLTLHFADIAADWNTATEEAPVRAAIDVLAFRREDGAIDIDKLSHAAKLLTFMLDLLRDGQPPLAIGLHNLSALLMSQAMSYDSNAGRMTAAALTALVTAEAYAASARLAALLGPSLDFAANREGILRSLRNHRRAAYGDRADYEKISVLPAPLTLDPGADIALAAAARRSWDDALELVQQHGLRDTGLTDLSPAPELAFFMESTVQGIAPLSSLTFTHADEADVYKREIYPAVSDALIKLGYDADARQKIIAHIAGAKTLAHAPGIDHAALRKRGFNDKTIGEIEHYLPFVDNVRLAITPWIVGEEFCRNILKIPAEKLRQPRFDLLRALGFSLADIEAANAFCYGQGNVRGAPALKPAHAAIFALADEISTEARIRMTASMQSFVSGDAEARVALAVGADAEECERVLLAAWRQGVKSVVLEFGTSAKPHKKKLDITARRAREKLPSASAPPPIAASLRSTMRGKPKAQSRIVSLGRGQRPTAGSGKTKGN